MQKTRTWKRVSAVMLTIAMLVGMLSVLGGLGFLQARRHPNR